MVLVNDFKESGERTLTTKSRCALVMQQYQFVLIFLLGVTIFFSLIITLKQ